jgi:hypothetical protein
MIFSTWGRRSPIARPVFAGLAGMVECRGTGRVSKAYEDDAATAGSLGWAVSRRLSHHLALLTEPGDVAWELRELIGQFPSR